MARYLVIAYQTADNPALATQLRSLAAEDLDARFVLLIPATATEHLRLASAGEAHVLAREAAERAQESFRRRGIELEAVRVGSPNPVAAATEELAEPGWYDHVVVSTFPPGASRWLKMDVVSRIQRMCSLPVTHVIAELEDSDRPQS